MNKTFFFIPVLIAGMLLINSSTAFAGESTRTFNYNDFKKIEISSGMHLNVIQSDSYNIEATGNQEDLNDLDVEKSGDVLKINFKRHSFFSFKHHHTVEFNIKMPQLTGLDLSGGANGKIKMDESSVTFYAELSGGSYLNGNLKCAKLSFDLSGGSKVEMSGNGGEIKIDGSGGSRLVLKDFYSTNANVELSGGSQASINMNGQLNADLSAGSHIYYYGKVELGTTDFSGGSGISKGK